MKPWSTLRFSSCPPACLPPTLRNKRSSAMDTALSEKSRRTVGELAGRPRVAHGQTLSCWTTIVMMYYFLSRRASASSVSLSLAASSRREDLLPAPFEAEIDFSLNGAGRWKWAEARAARALARTRMSDLYYDVAYNESGLLITLAGGGCAPYLTSSTTIKIKLRRLPIGQIYCNYYRVWHSWYKKGEDYC